MQLAQEGDTATVAVSDQGMGIPAADIPHLFERFFRAHNADAQHLGGVGIGLYVVNEIVTRHGGTISVTSEEERGSCFTLTLPLTQPPHIHEGGLTRPRSFP